MAITARSGGDTSGKNRQNAWNFNEKAYMSATATLFTPPLRGATAHLADELQAGRVYRREDFARLSNAVDRHLRELVSTGVLKKLAQGLYYAPKQSNFGPFATH